MRSIIGYLPDSTYAGPPVLQQDFTVLAPMLTANSGAEYHVPEFLPCFDQRIWGSCVLQSWVGLLEILKGLEDGTVEPLSIAWLYALARLAQNNFDDDTGTWPSLAADRIQKIGVVPEAAFPYVAANLPRTPNSPPVFRPVHPSPAIYVEASDNKVDALFHFDDSGKVALLDNIEHSVRGNQPVVWGAPVSVSELESWGKNDAPLNPPKKDDGNHATLITGVKTSSTGRRAFKVRNSWGTSFGDNGYVWLSEEFVLTGFDYWTGTRMQKLLI